MKNLNSKSLLIIVSCLTLSLIIGIIILSYLEQQREKSKKPPVIPKEEIFIPQKGKVDKIKIVKNTLSCLDKIRDSKGLYAHGKKYNKDGTSEITGEDRRVGLNVLWAKTKYVEKTNDQEEKQALIEDINLYMDSAKVPFLAADFWSKKQLFQMYNSRIFSATEKNKIKSIIDKTVLDESNELLEVEKKIKDTNYNPPESEKLLSLITQKRGSGKILTDDELKKNASFVSDYLSIHRSSQEEDDLNIARDLLYSLANSYFLKKDRSIIAKSTLGMAAAELYQTTREKPYLDFAFFLFNEINHKEACWWPEKYYCPTNMFAPVLVADLSSILGKLKTGNSDYSQVKNKIIENLISRNLDEEIKDGCFFEGQISKQKTIKTLENSLMVDLLLE